MMLPNYYLKVSFSNYRKLLPAPRQKLKGRKYINKEVLLIGILQVLVNGVAWRKIADCSCSYASCWRSLNELQRELKLIFQTLAREKVDITLTDKMGLPADVLFGKGTIDDKKFVPYHIKNTAGKRKKVLNLDMGYMSLSLRRSMRQKKIRVNMGVREQDYRRKRGPKFKFDKQIYYKRLMLERTNGWVKAFRSIRLRRSACPAMFKAMVYMALIIVLIR